MHNEDLIKSKLQVKQVMRLLEHPVQMYEIGSFTHQIEKSEFPPGLFQSR